MSSKAPALLKKAVNDTAKESQKMIVDRAAQIYKNEAGKSEFKNSSTINKATIGRKTATIYFKGPVKDIEEFKTSIKPSEATISRTEYTKGGKRKSKMIKAKILKYSAMKNLNLQGGDKDGKDLKAFITKFSNGKIAIVQRVPSKKMKGNPKKELIKKFYGSSIPYMVGSDRVLGAMENTVLNIVLKEYTERAIEKMMEG